VCFDEFTLNKEGHFGVGRVLMLLSQIIYWHRPASISPTIVRAYGTRKNCPIFYYICRHRTVPGEV